jgi:hypothetical protein
LFKHCVVGTSPKESVGAPDQMTVSQHSKSEGWPPSPLSPPPSSLFCNLCIKELYLRHKFNQSYPNCCIIHLKNNKLLQWLPSNPTYSRNKYLQPSAAIISFNYKLQP